MTKIDWDDTTAYEDKSFKRLKNGLRIFWDLGEGYHKKWYLFIAVTALMQVLNLLFPYFLKLSLDSVGNNESAVWMYLAIAMVVMLFGLVVLSFVLRPLSIFTLIDLENKLPVKLQEKMFSLSKGYHANNSVSKNIAKILKGIDKHISMQDRLAWGFLPNVMYLILNMIFLVVVDWKIGAIFFVLILPGVWLNMRSYRKFQPVWEDWDKRKEVGNKIFFGGVYNVSTVKARAAEEFEVKRFSDVRYGMMDLDKGAWRELLSYLFGIGSFMMVGFGVAVSYGIYTVTNGTNTVGTVLFIAMTLNVARQSIWGIINDYAQILRDIVSLERLQAVLDEEAEITSKENAIVPKSYIGDFEFKNVGFGYNDVADPIFVGLSLKLSPNTMTAFVGPSGSGKSTLLQLLSRSYDVTSGGIILDGVDLRDLDLAYLKKKIVEVPQEIELFDDSILDNVRYGDFSASEEEVISAMKKAGLENVLIDTSKFPDGIYTVVGESGVKLSGGEKQRVGIARAFLAISHGAKVLVLDEATSSLDSVTERAIQGMIESLRQETNISIIVIAHRLSTIYSADRICVLEKGKIVEDGDHAKLMRQNGLYSKLVQLQDSGVVTDDC